MFSLVHVVAFNPRKILSINPPTGWGSKSGNIDVVMYGENPPIVLLSFESCELWNKDIQLYHCVSIVSCFVQVLQEVGKKMERSREQPMDKTRLNQQTSTPKRSQHKAWVRRSTLAVLPE
jgi:hypothetical protein